MNFSHRNSFNCLCFLTCRASLNPKSLTNLILLLNLWNYTYLKCKHSLHSFGQENMKKNFSRTNFLQVQLGEHVNLLRINPEIIKTIITTVLSVSEGRQVGPRMHLNSDSFINLWLGKIILCYVHYFRETKVKSVFPYHLLIGSRINAKLAFDRLRNAILYLDRIK